MSAVSNAFVEIGRFVAADDHHVDDQGYTTHHWLLPENAEIIYGGIAFVVILFLGWKFKVVPMAKKAFAARTEKIQGELDESANAQRDAEAEAAHIRQSLGNIDAERQRLIAEAEAQAEALLADGRARLEAEVVDLEAKAETDIASVSSRSTDELRAEIARLASAAADRVVERSLDDATKQSLIEDFIANVGATSPAGASR